MDNMDKLRGVHRIEEEGPSGHEEESSQGQSSRINSGTNRETKCVDDEQQHQERIEREKRVEEELRQRVWTPEEENATYMIQVQYRKYRKDDSRRKWKTRLQRVRMALTFRMNAKTEAYKKRAQETEIKLRSLVPKYLQWSIARHFFDDTWLNAAASAREVEGIVVFIDLKGYTSMTEHLSKIEVGSVILKKDVFTVDNSAEFANNVVSKYWELVVSFVHKYRGDVIKFLGDGLQILFPLEPVFTNAGVNASQLCKQRAVLFSLELLEALRGFELDSTVLGFKKMSLKIGMAYGKAYALVLGGVCLRYEMVITGDPVERASQLSERGGKASIAVVDEQIARAVGLELERGQNYGVLEMDGGFDLKVRTEKLLETLSKDFSVDIDDFYCPYTNQQIDSLSQQPMMYKLPSKQNVRATDFQEFRKSVVARSKLKDSFTSVNDELDPSGSNRKRHRFSSCSYSSGRQSCVSVDASITARKPAIERDNSFSIAPSVSSRTPDLDNEGNAQVLEVVDSDVENKPKPKLRSRRRMSLVMYETEEKLLERLQRQERYLWNLTRAEGKDFEGKNSEVLNEMNILGGFVPIFTLSQVISGQSETHFGSRFLSVMFVQVMDVQASDKPDLDLMQLASTEAQIAIYSHFGDLRQICMDDKGFVIIGVFGISGKDPEESATLAAFELTERFSMCGIRAGVGIASGICHFGMTGSQYRGEFTVVGSTVNLAARLMSKAVFLAENEACLSSTSFILLEEDTLLNLPQDILLEIPFGKVNVEIKGWYEPVTVYFPSEESVLEEESERVSSCLETFSQTTHSVPTSMNNSTGNQSRTKAVPIKARSASIRKKRVEDRRRSSNVSVMLEQIQGSDTLHEVLKHLAVMAAVNPFIDVDILYSLLHSEIVRYEMEYALNALCSRYRLLEKVNDDLFRAKVDHELMGGLYQSLLRSFRSCLHAQLATLYEERCAAALFRKRPYDVYEVIATHFALAGDDYHLRAAENYNLSLSSCEKSDVERIEDLGKKAQSLVKSWNELQQMKGEKVHAYATYHLAKLEQHRNRPEHAVQEYVNTLFCYRSMAEHFGERRGTDLLLRRTEAILFVHYMDDSNSFSFRFRCLYFNTKTLNNIQVVTLQCTNRQLHLKHSALGKPFNCSVDPISHEAVGESYSFNTKEDWQLTKNKQLYMIVIADAVASRHVLLSLAEMSKFGPGSKNRSRKIYPLREVSTASMIEKESVFGTYRKMPKPKNISSSCVVS